MKSSKDEDGDSEVKKYTYCCVAFAGKRFWKNTT